MGFTKLDSEIIDSSIWDENSNVLKVFIAFWTKSNPEGVVNATYNAMFRTANLCDKNKKPLPVKEFDNALKVLMEKDDTSRSKEHDGRRIIRIEESKWLITTYRKRRDYTYSDNPESIRKRKYRENKKLKSDGTDKRDTSQSVPGHSASASVSTSYSLSDYLKEELDNYNSLISDKEWLDEQQKYNPNLNILLSLEKAHKQFWGTEYGYNHKMKNKKKKFNWKSTYQKALSQKVNWVWLTKEEKEKVDKKILQKPKDAYEAYCRTTSSPSEMILNRLIGAWKEYDKKEFESYEKIPSSSNPKFSDYMKQIFWIGKKYPPKKDVAKFIKKVKEYFEGLK